MTQQQLVEQNTKLFEYIKNNETENGGLYYIDYRTIERVCGSYASAIYLYVGKSDIATFMTEQKGLIIEANGIEIVLNKE